MKAASFTPGITPGQRPYPPAVSYPYRRLGCMAVRRTGCRHLRLRDAGNCKQLFRQDGRCGVDRYSELFPISIRSTASGFCFNFGRVGAIAGIKLVPVMIPIIGFGATISLASVSYFLAAIMVFTLKETKGIELTSGN